MCHCKRLLAPIVLSAGDTVIDSLFQQIWLPFCQCYVSGKMSCEMMSTFRAADKMCHMPPSSVYNNVEPNTNHHKYSALVPIQSTSTHDERRRLLRETVRPDQPEVRLRLPPGGACQ